MGFRGGAHFNRVDNKIEIPGTSGFWAGDKFAVRVRFIPKANILNYYRTLVAKGYGYSSEFMLRLTRASQGNQIIADVGDGTVLYRVSGPSLENGKEYDVIAGIENGQVKLSINGDIYTKNLGAKATTANNIWIGMNTSSSGEPYAGIIKEVQIYDGIGPSEINNNPVVSLNLTHGHTLDLSGRGNHGTPYNIRYIGVNPKYGLWFPGTSGSYVDVGNIFAGQQQLVVGIEFQPNHFADYQGIIGKWDAADLTTKEWLIALFPNGLLKLFWADNIGYESIEFTTDKSHQKIIAVIDTVNQRAELWEDGVLKASGVPTKIIQTTAQSLRIGTYRLSSTFFKGLIKSVWIKTSIPSNISQEFIRWGQNADAYWDFTTGSLKDWAGRGYDGVAYGNVRFVGI